MAFSYEIEKKKKYTDIRMKGMLLSSMETSPLIKSLQFSDPASARFLIDLDGLNYMNSEGFNTMVKILTFARNHGGDVVLINLSTELKQLFIISKLNSIFTIAENKRAAISLLNG